MIYLGDGPEFVFKEVQIESFRSLPNRMILELFVFYNCLPQ